MWIIFAIIVILSVIAAFGRAFAKAEQHHEEQHEALRNELHSSRTHEQRLAQEERNERQDEIARRTNPSHGKADWS